MHAPPERLTQKLHFAGQREQYQLTVDNGPADFLAGHDRQIEKAIEVLRTEIK